ncbi:thioredoxin, mitochondrial-like [Trichosurus vulpecula]|uniref:thioredoxin, mitochondrial-like n=1 Tax=Trichosurus vulpecula TaxID=9337 RepID=UPI00186B4AE0|nr:thioredoxin, mitochondrial-like [Trichosurus vulpecula]
MAQRLVLSRSLALFMARKLPMRRWAPPCARVLQATPKSTGIREPSFVQLLYATCVHKTTFHIWDGLDFQERVLDSSIPVVVDFYAQWCGPCKILGPRLEKMVARQEGKVVMAKVDIDENTDLAVDFEVLAVPTVLAIKNGDVVDKLLGLKNEEQIEAFLKKLINC